MSDPRSITERYLSSTASSNLRVKESTCDADKLLAAAYVTAGDPRKSLALRVWRVRATGSLSGTDALTRGLGALTRKHGRRNKLLLTWPEAQALALRTLDWWRDPICRHCDGLGHPKMENAPVLDMTRECPHCRGTGQMPLERYVRAEHADVARWLVGQMEALSSVVFDDMARLLRKQLDF